MTVKVAACAEGSAATASAPSSARSAMSRAALGLRRVGDNGGRLAEVLHIQPALGVDGHDQRVLEAPLEVQLHPAPGDDARSLDQTLMRRAQRVAELRREL